MNKSALIAMTAERTGISKKDAAAAIETALDLIRQTVAAGEKVQIRGFGTFETRRRKPRIARNPRTKEIFRIEERRVPVFRPGECLTEAVAENTDDMKE